MNDKERHSTILKEEYLKVKCPKCGKLWHRTKAIYCSNCGSKLH